MVANHLYYLLEGYIMINKNVLTYFKTNCLVLENGLLFSIFCFLIFFLNTLSASL